MSSQKQLDLMYGDEPPIRINIKDEEYEFFPETSAYLKKVNNVLTVKTKFFANDKKVPDVHRYNLVYKDNKWILTKPCDNPIDAKNVSECDRPITNTEEANNILVILESPHKDEYDEKFKPIAPANGVTGKNFSKYFISHVLPILFSLGLTLCNKKTYSICFVNPVPFQASLYEIIKEESNSNFTKKIWRKLFNKCKNDFKNRVQSYSPIVIINSCTTGVNARVKDCIKQISFTTAVQGYETIHPSAWIKLVEDKFL